MKRDEIYVKNIAARKDKRNRIKKMKNFMKINLDFIITELTQLIFNSKTI